MLAALAALAAGAAQAGPPYVTDDPEPVELGHWEVYGFTAGAHQHSANTSGVLPGLEVNYGAAPGLQLHAILNYAYDVPSGGSWHSGLGDTELGLKYRFVNPEKDDWYPQVGIFPLLEVPTGDASHGLGTGQTLAFLPVWLQKDWDEWTTYGGGGYWINPGPGNRNYWFFGWLLQRQVTKSLALGVEVFHQTPSVDGGNGVSGFNLGGVFDFTERHHLLFSAGRGGQQYAVDGAGITMPFAYYLAFQWTS
ncbi:MAG: hypothetical protein P4L83_23375 [Nevskia sp.]|nr:hypothetical protein [Nevskia sp.]